MKPEKKLEVNAIENGTVIDHIPAQNLFKVIKILKLDNLKTMITFGTNLDSKKLKKKAIIKLADKYFEDDEINKIILVAPTARLNIIKDYKVVEKKVVEVPSKIEGIAKCVNPKCITNHENIMTRFSVMYEQEVALKCDYCEKITDQEHLKIL